MLYLVTGSNGPKLTSPEETITVLDHGIIPTFQMLQKLEAQKKIIVGGLPAGERAFVFILEAASNEEVDQCLRDLPAWGALDWKVMPLQSFAGREKIEREILAKLKNKHG